MKNKSFEIIEKFYKSVVFEGNLLNLPENRLKIYQNLVFNNIEDTCSKAFPISKKILKDKWDDLIEEFIKSWKFETPYLWETPKDFINFLEKKGFFKENLFLKDLMMYEWVEVEVFNEDVAEQNVDFNWNLKYRISPSARILIFNYPVHKISNINLEEIESIKGKYFLIVFQNPENFEVEYLEITEFLWEIIKNIQNDTLINIVKKTCEKFSVKFEDLKESLEDFFMYLLSNKIVNF
jgi:hypothetical protein